MPATVERTQANGTQPITPPPPPRPPRRQRDSDNSGYWAAFSVLLGMLVVVLGFVGT
jgi:hypothetical protein